MQIPQLQLTTQPFQSTQECVKHVPQHVSSIEGNHWNQVCETEQDVDPHQPEKQVRRKKEDIGPRQGSKQAVPSRQQGFFKRVNRNAVHLEREDQNGCLLYTSPSPRDS